MILKLFLKKDGDNSGTSSNLLQNLESTDNNKSHIFSIDATETKQTLQVVGTLIDITDKTPSVLIVVL